MKKAKMFLAASAVIMVVGGTMAVKAHSRNFRNLYYCDASNICRLSGCNDASGAPGCNIALANLYIVGTPGQPRNLTTCISNPTQAFVNQ